MYKTIVVPLDGSGLAEQAIPYAQAIAKAYKARVKLLRVLESVHAQLVVPEPGLFTGKLAERFHQAAEDYLEAKAKTLRDDGIAVSTSVKSGLPADEIIKLAGNDPSAIVVMSARGKSGIVSWLLGSVTTKVLHRGTPNVIVVPVEKAPGRIQKISTLIVPLDGSINAEQAIPHAASLAKAMKLKLVLMQAAPAESIFEGLPGVSERQASRILEENKERSNLYLDKVESRLKNQGISDISKTVSMGYPADSISELAGKSKGALVVMTAHGKSSTGTWLLGSVTDKMVRRSTSPVLVIRPAEIKKAIVKKG